MIRHGTITDLPQITQVRTSVRENHLSVEDMTARGITHETIAARMDKGNLGVWVAEIENHIIAFSMADRTDGNIFALFTLPGQEGQGYGNALLAECEAWLKQNGLTKAKLDTGRETTAHRFYLKRGWIEVESKPGDGESAILEKQL
jgi:GNAT superfamily N-acetyltransferase